MKKILLLIVLLIPVLGLAQDKVEEITITQPNAPLVVTGNATNATGNGVSDGAVFISVADGSPGYTFNWNNGATSQNISGLPAGNYNVTVTDAKGCTDTFSTTVNEPAPLTVQISKTNIDCNGNNSGQLSATASGGTQPYSYSWEKLISGSYQNVGSGGPNLNTQYIGQYRVTVRDANSATNSITKQATATLSQPAQLTVGFTKTNVLCFGKNTGRIDLTIAGGTAPYIVNWIDVTGTNNPVDRTNLVAGDYAYKITDANGCEVDNYSAAITITQPANAIVITAATNGIQNPTYNGATNGSIDVNVLGGTGGSTYAWSNGASTQDLTGLSNGTYTLTATDANGCTGTASFTLNDPPPLSVSINITQIIQCNGGSGTLQATAVGGVPNPGPSYDYDWFNMSSGTAVSLGITTATASNLTPGDYRVIATDNNGNTTSTDQSLIEPDSLIFTGESSANVLCFGGNDGTAGVTVAGGTPAYTYAWTKTGDAGYTAATPSINSLTAGVYNLLVTDANTCTINTSFTISQPANAVSLTLVDQTNVTINGENTGAIDITVSGGTPSYTYLWSKTGDVGFNETTQDLTNVNAGEYTVDVRDLNSTSASNNGCIATQTFIITEPLALNASVAITNPISCFEGTNGELTAIVSGGVAPFSYAWFEIIGGVPNDLGMFTNIISGLDIGEYQVQVTDANGASTNNTILLTEPLKLLANVVSTTNANCFGESSGSIAIEVSGGTGNYTYSWSDANGTLSYSTQDLVNIPIGDYNVSIQDKNGCLVTLTAIPITQPSNPLSMGSSPIITNASGNGLSNGSIEVMVAGGTAPYSYLWIDGLNNTLTSTTNVLDTVGAGSYYLTVTDSNNCSLGPIEYTVSEPDPLIAPISTTPIPCFGETGTLSTTASGGIAPYAYKWHNDIDSTTILSTTNTLTTISGSYTLLVTDANGIETIQNINLIEPSQLNLAATQTNVLCTGEATGSIDLTVTGGTGNYTYNWSNTAITQDISGLIAGTYTVTVRDANFCEDTLSVTLTQPNDALSISSAPTITNATGNGLTDGRIEVNVAGGITPYNYLWTDALNNTLTSTTNILEGIGAGRYFLTVTDDNSCTLGPIEYTVDEPDAIAAPITTTPIACFGGTGTLSATVSGGISPYTYNWYNDLDSTTTLSNTSSITTIAGAYTLVITDANGIENIQNINLSEPAELIIDAIITTDVKCYNGSDGSIEINVSGGTGAYTYLWNNSGSTTNTQNGLTAGTYTVVVTDASGCSVSSGSVTILQPEAFTITGALLIRPTNTSTSDGSITIDISGGISPFNYEWFDAVNMPLQVTTNATSTSNSINNLNEGLYTVVITDSTGCAFTTDYNLANPGELLLSVDLLQPVSCFGGNNGILSVTTIGGAGGNNYAWYNAVDNSQIGNTQTLNGVKAGSYYVIVSNADGLQEQSAIIQVTEPDAITVILSQINPTCFAYNDGSITISANGGSGIYEYNYRFNSGTYNPNWFAFDTNNSSQITLLTAGNYEFRIRDASGCFYEQNGTIGTVSTTLVQPDNLVITSATLNNPTGFGLTNGSIEVAGSGGTLPYNYVWNDSNGVLTETTNILSNVAAGDYTLVITDFNNCVVQQSYTLNQPQELSVNIQSVNIVQCNGDNGASLNAIATGGASPYSYAWFKLGTPTSIGSVQTPENLNTGNYYVVITDTNANTIQSTPFSVSEPDPLEMSLFSNFVSCGDGNDWEINPNISGGTEPYTYTWSNGTSDNNLSNVLPGTYTLTITDANGCIQSESITLVPPLSLSVSEIVTNPTCFQGTDGAIETNINGGTLPYTYSWNNGESTANISNVTAGNYQLTITDFKGCELIQTFVLSDPDELLLDLGGDITLCSGQTHTVYAETLNGISYQWTSDNGFSSTNQIVELSQAGVYRVTAVNTMGCIATDEITISQSDQVISAEFLVSTQVFVDDVFYIIDDSDPIPDNIVWILPEEAELISESSTYAEIRFDTAGEYEITMITIVGDCTDAQTKTILVIEQEAFLEEESNGLDPIITDFSVFPNPSDGNFNVSLEFREVLPASLKIFGLVNNSMMDYRTFDGESSYQTSYSLNVPSGVYFLILETAFATQLQKIVIE